MDMDETWKNGLLIYNGHAGQGELRERLGQISGILAETCDRLSLIATKEPGDTERICREEGEMADVVFVLGGDGTVHEAVNGCADLDSPPVLGILPGGTCNDFSRALGIPQPLDKAAAAMASRKVDLIDIGRMNDRWFSNFMGIGLIAEVSENQDAKLKQSMGRLSYYVSTFKTLSQARPFHYQLETDQGRQEGEAVMILAANGFSLGAVQIPSPSISLEDGLLDLFIVREAGLSSIRHWFTQGASLLDESQEDIVYLQTSEFTLQTEHGMAIDMDGEMYRFTPADVSVKKKKLPFLTGTRPVRREQPAQDEEDHKSAQQ
ncbi:diacylglycerol/lipid kinase family protein [Marinicrinis sediminis]|uniref:Diacylglycerol/lipid kinase family protein n=1 Tax=Marinicrinis sediminis TaxID=1652465 RepID=A0ABW5REW5_9BACL